MNKSFLGTLIIVLIVAMVLAACGTAPQPAPDKSNDQGKTTPKSDVNVVQVVTDQWQKSAHATAVEADTPETSPGMRDGCALCHNGYDFELQKETLDGIGILKGASCDTCHIQHGLDLMKAGTVSVPIGDLKGGLGSVCIACHNGRGKTPNQKSAPHHSVQADMLFAKSGAEVQGFTYGSVPHSAASNTCLGCHMTPGSNGVRDHLFKMNVENIAGSCGKCHDFKSFNPAAAGDYDGDGKKEGIQDEVTGLLDVLDKAITGKLNGGSYESVHGGVEFKDASGKVLDTPPSKELYNAVWNRFFVEYDGSKGIHNPMYAVQLLQQSYKAVMGKDVPGADIWTK